MSDGDHLLDRISGGRIGRFEPDLLPVDIEHSEIFGERGRVEFVVYGKRVDARDRPLPRGAIAKSVALLIASFIIRRIVGGLAVALMTTGCGGDLLYGRTGVEPGPPKIVALEGLISQNPLALGTEADLSAEVTYADGRVEPVLPHMTVPGTAPFSITGFTVQPMRIGTGVVVIYVGTASDAVDIEIVAGTSPVAAVVIPEGDAQIRVGDTLERTAVITFIDGTTQPGTGVVEWGDVPPDSAQFSDGQLTALQPGIVSLRAQYGGAWDEVHVTITE